MEPLTGAAHAAMFVSPADAKVALPPVLWSLDAAALLAIAAVIVALVPLFLVLRGSEGPGRSARVRRVLALVKRPASGFGAPTVVWQALGAAGRAGSVDTAEDGEGLATTPRVRALSDRG